MRTGLEFAGFGVAAVAVHLAAFAAIAPDGMTAGGDGGEGSVTVAAPLGAAPIRLCRVPPWSGASCRNVAPACMASRARRPTWPLRLRCQACRPRCSWARI